MDTGHGTISIGVANFPDISAPTPQAGSRLRTALYDAKQAGRNRVRVAPPHSIN
jgi:PleD family two-component response regulator